MTPPAESLDITQARRLAPRRGRQYRVHPWWGDVLREHRGVARSVLRRIEHEGPLRSLDLEARRTGGTLEVLSARFESPKPAARDREALGRTLERFSASVGLRLRDPSRSG